MVNAASVATLVLTKAASYVYYLVQHTLETALSGNQEAAVRLALGLLIVWLTLSILGRLARTLYGTVKLAFKLALVAGVAFLGMSIYINGVSVTANAIHQLYRSFNYDSAVRYGADIAQQYGESLNVDAALLKAAAYKARR